MMTIAFWTAIGFVAYTLVGYPTLLWLLSRVRKRSQVQGDIEPFVSIIIVAYNEASRIAAKIANTLAIDYPREKLEVIVGSDGSTDSTQTIVRSFATQGVKLVESSTRRGKHYIQMMARDVAQGEILVFTDASIVVERRVLRRIVSHFADSSVGAVSSVDELMDAKKDWLGEHFYVYGEMGLRHLEGQVSSLVSLSGGLFAVRRALCDTWNPELSSDFFVALNVAAHDMRTIQDPECRAGLGVVKSEKAELSRKVRTIVHGLAVFFSYFKLVNPFRYGLFSWQLISHKLFRWLLPFALIAVLVSNLFLWRAGVFYQITLILQLLGYGAGVVSYAAGGRSKSGVLRLASFFVLGNLATLLAWWKYCLGDKMVIWEPSRRN
ncbi:MAG TPA: glycosyltransferase [Terriglobia bacterium]|nr:glycosyltransferase [Terriglobia bacterium]